MGEFLLDSCTRLDSLELLVRLTLDLVRSLPIITILHLCFL